MCPLYTDLVPGTMYSVVVSVTGDPTIITMPYVFTTNTCTASEWPVHVTGTIPANQSPFEVSVYNRVGLLWECGIVTFFVH